MTTEWTSDYAFEQLAKHEKVILAASGANEATTRMRAIDTLLFQVLGWDKLAVETEKYVREVGYADYAAYHGGHICLVLEAKRSDATFVLPTRNYGDRPIGFGLLSQECPMALAAMTQASGYAASLGSRYVAISNGHQWLLAQAYVPGQPLEERLVFVFESVKDVKKRFQQFWDCFSPAGIHNNLPSGPLLESRKAPAPAKLATTILNYPIAADRNFIVNEIGYVLGHVWEEMGREEDSTDFLRKCYIRPTSSSDCIALAQQLLGSRREQDEKLESLSVHSTADMPQIVQSETSNRPIVVLGGVGHGKTTFLRYLRLVAAEKTLRNYIQIDIDFLDRPDQRADVADYIYKEVDRKLREQHGIDIHEDGLVRGSLHGELIRFRASPAGKLFEHDTEEFRIRELAFIEHLQQDTHSFYSSVFAHLKRGRKRSLSIFLDNLDRRNDPIQEEAFLKASSIARDWACLVFICLRPGTYFRSLNEGVLDSVAPKTIVVVSPRTDVLLRKRFVYAEAIANGVRDVRGTSDRGSQPRAISLQLPTTAEFLGCCENSIRRNKSLTELFDAISNGNVRDLLRYVKDVLSSKHLNTVKIVEKMKRGYMLAEHEALRALLFGDFLLYDPKKSLFVNLFDLVRADPMHHFSRFLILHYLSRLSDGAGPRGLCDIDGVVTYMCQLGYTGEHAREAVQFLHRTKYCEFSVPGLRWDEGDGKIRITSRGKYHIFHLVGTFVYIDAMVVDTPILDASVREKIEHVNSIEGRLERAVLFLEYLDSCAGAIQDADVKELWKETRDSISEDIERVRESASRTRRR